MKLHTNNFSWNKESAVVQHSQTQANCLLVHGDHKMRIEAVDCRNLTKNSPLQPEFS